MNILPKGGPRPWNVYSFGIPEQMLYRKSIVRDRRLAGENAR
jgi:hypothetical protein